MRATDIMSKPVISVSPKATVQELAQILLENRISAVPVVGENGVLLGMVSEGDLMERVETGTVTPPSWWLDLFTSTETILYRFIKSHGRRVEDVMTPNPITVGPEASLAKIAKLLERYKIKRVPVVEGNTILGIVSRANLLHGLVAINPPSVASSQGDRAIRDAVQQAISEGSGASGAIVNVLVQDGVVHLMGTVASSREEQAILVATEGVPGVKAIENELGRIPAWAFGY